MARHAYLPTVKITDTGSKFVSNVRHEKADVLGNTIRHATTKEIPTNKDLKRTYATKKTSLEMSSGEFRKQWHKYLPLAIYY